MLFLVNLVHRFFETLPLIQNLNKDLDIDIVWFDDTDDYVKILSQYIKGDGCIGVDKFWNAKFLLPLNNTPYQ